MVRVCYETVMAHSPEMPVRIRRFYKTVSVSPADSGFLICLDGRGARTPAGRPLRLPTAALAELIRAEWAAQGNQIVLHDMLATRLAHTALDGVADRHDETVREFARFADTDLLCYFAEHPAVLVKREHETWGPLLDWARDDLGLAFERTSGVAHRLQPPEVLAGIVAHAEAVGSFELAGLAFGAARFGSAILILALRAGRINAQETLAAARLDEIFQEEHWGVDDEAASHAARMARETIMLENWFRALG